jgi:ADP-heptose:LPS heptosyltransferase
MTLGFMQKIDQLLGLPIVKLLSLFTRQQDCLAGPSAQVPVPKRVIVTKFIGLGSITLALPMLHEMRSRGVRVAFWTFESQAGFVRLTGLADEVWIVRSSLTKLPFDFIKNIWKAYRFKADAFIDLEPTANCTAILARLSGAPERLGFLCGKPVREQLFTRLVAINPMRHMSLAYTLLVRYLGIGGDTPTRLPELPLQVMKAASANKPSPGVRRITISVNTSDLGRNLRMWAPDRWVELCNTLLKNPETELIFPGVKNEWETNENIIKRLTHPERAKNLAGKTDFVTLLAMLRTSEVIFSVDSGIMHLAAWVDVPLVGLFGPETPTLYGPLSENSVSLWAGLSCSPCCTIATEKHTRCRDNRCMQEISVAQVLAAAEATQRRLKRPPIRPAA